MNSYVSKECETTYQVDEGSSLIDPNAALVRNCNSNSLSIQNERELMIMKEEQIDH